MNEMQAARLAELRARFDALGPFKNAYAAGVIAALIGALLPLVTTVPVAFVTWTGYAVHFYDIGPSGWMLFVVLAVLAVGPMLPTVGGNDARRSRAYCSLSGLAVGLVVCVVAIAANFGSFVQVGAGGYAWLVSAISFAVYGMNGKQ